MAPTSTRDTTREWVSFEDPDEERTWVFDVSFLLSGWGCIFGRGCQGVLTGPSAELVQGCCSYGAHFTDDEDVARVEAAAATMGPEDWEFHKQGNKRGLVKTNKAGERMSRLVDGACVFLNRPGFAKGPGCALHQVALERGQQPLELKPEVCWQLPLRREDHEEGGGHVTSTITDWKRRNWGDGGDEFHWWCTESPDAFIEREPVYRTLRHELVAMVGAPVYLQLAEYLDDRGQRKAVPLPHPAVRTRNGSKPRK